jgi:hypothetical protein
MTIAAADSVLRDGSIISWIDFVVFQRRMISSVKAMCLIVYTEGKKVFGTGAIKHSMTALDLLPSVILHVTCMIFCFK